MRAVLDRADFRKLIGGEQITIIDRGGGPKLTLILEDIGWAAMLMAIDEAMIAQRDAALEKDLTDDQA